MKGIFKSKSRVAAGVFIAIIVVFAGCTKDPSIDEIGVRLKFIQASPDANAVQFQLNAENAHTPALSYKDTTPYLQFEGGTYNLAMAAGSAVPLNTIIDFTPRSNYSLFALDSAGKIKLTVIKDDLSPITEPLRMKMRFFNLSPNAGSVFLRAVNNRDTITLAAGRSFNDFSLSAGNAKFTQLPSKEYDLLLYSGATLLTKLPAQTLAPYRFYTIYARGFVRGTGEQAISLGVITNN